jgi:hypothetical protein
MLQGQYMPFPIPVPPWNNPDLVLYHGTIQMSAIAITSDGIALSEARIRTDFGPGFYTTTHLEQAREWAAKKSRSIRGSAPAVVAFRIERNALSQLDALFFVRGNHDALDFWRLVHYCRDSEPVIKGRADHLRQIEPAAYDVIAGPVARFPTDERLIYSDMDQVSFHTQAALDLLQRQGAEII